MSANLKATKNRMTGNRSNRNFMAKLYRCAGRGSLSPGACRPGGLECQGGRIDAVTLAARRGFIGVGMPQMRVAGRAQHFGAAYQPRQVFLGANRAFGGAERRPARARVELVA